MDLLDFEPTAMYFDEPLDPRAAALIEAAAEAYGEQQAEAYLREAEALQPRHLSVLVALYRYYFYRHQLDAALIVAAQAMDVAAGRLGFDGHWQALDIEDIARATAAQPELARFYLHALKGAGYLHLRLGNVEDGLNRLDHVAALDAKDRLGAKALADVARRALETNAA